MSQKIQQLAHAALTAIGSGWYLHWRHPLADPAMESWAVVLLFFVVLGAYNSRGDS
jgi:hypothetical protein